jgi:hypothetical protein
MRRLFSSPDPMPKFARLSSKTPLFFLHGFGLLIVLGLIGLRILAAPLTLEPDSGRYVAMGLNLADYGTLTNHGYRPDAPPPPALAEGGPLTAVEIALAARLHAPTRQTLICLAAAGYPGRACNGSLAALQWLYALELAVFLFALYRIALLVFAGDAWRAWIAVFAALACKEIWQYSRHILTEPLFQAMAVLFLWAWLAAWRDRGAPAATRWLLAGLALGVTALVKPSWLALAPVALALIALFAWRRLVPRALLLALGAFALGFALPAGGLLLRNYLQLGQWTMSDSHYLIGSLSHRLAFNMMSWREWAMGWIYYLPGFGDDIANRLFGAEAVARLGWDPGGYYVEGRDVLHPRMKLLPPAEAQRYLLQTYLFSDLFKDLAVTALLAMRGLFVGGKWGLFGLLAAIPLLLWLLRGDQRRLWWLLLLPALAMVGINAQLSVSIVRYNLALVPAFALALAAVVYAVGAFLAAKAMRRDRM